MQQAVPENSGAMAAVLGASSEDVAAACREASEATGEVVTPANSNSPQQTVIAGSALAVERAVEAGKQRGAKRAVPLKVSAPFHCSLMAPAAEQLALEMKPIVFADPSPPVVTNASPFERLPTGAYAMNPERGFRSSCVCSTFSGVSTMRIPIGSVSLPGSG